jgi:hypothetical protein
MHEMVLRTFIAAAALAVGVMSAARADLLPNAATDAVAACVEPVSKRSAPLVDICLIPTEEVAPDLGSAIYSPFASVSEPSRTRQVAEMRASIAQEDRPGLTITWIALLACAGTFGCILRWCD